MASIRHMIHKFGEKHKNTVETVKLTILIIGIISGIVRDITSATSREFYLLHEQYQNSSESIQRTKKPKPGNATPIATDQRILFILARKMPLGQLLSNKTHKISKPHFPITSS